MKTKCLACILTAVLACILTAVLGATPYSVAFAMENNNQQIIFNQNDFDSDTHGNFPGSVSFVQNSIMPSHHGVPNDVQPHLTSLRKTMVLFKPKGDIENHSEVTITAKNSENEIVYEGMMITPDELTKIAGQNDFVGYEIPKPDEFDRVISDNATLSNFANDPEGTYFQELFNTYNSIHIKTSDGNWTKDFYLPDGPQFNNKVVTFTSNATYNSNVFYNDTPRTLSRGNEFTLKNVNGVWVDREIPKPDEFDRTISDNETLSNFEDAPADAYFQELFNTYNSIHIKTSDGNWTKDFYLPDGPQFNNKVVTFTSNATYKSNVFYNTTSRTLSRGNEFTLKNVNGVWDDREIQKPSEFDRTISDNETLSNFEDAPADAYFQELFNTYNSIHIQTSNGNWTRNFYLPDGQQFNNKVVTFTSNAGYDSNIFYTNNSLTLSRGNEFTLENVDGIWHSTIDIEMNKIVYISKAFSSILPASLIEPGLQLSFKSGNKESEITNLNIGAPNELIVHTIDLGMLTPPRDEFSFQKDPELHRQYFHQLPISRLTVSEYEPQYFTEVMLPNGQLLTDFDPSQGDVYSGTMRQKIAKELVSHGIDNANYGINSSGGNSERWHPFSSAQFTAHNAVGKYANGVQVHGLSGGNGMVTLKASIGNEFSHELGHNFGLGHYPGGFNGAINRPADQVNSTWGWDADHNFFIPNFEKAITNDDQCYESECTPPFAGHRFGAGAMSGGAPLYTVHNGYTLHTPYELNSIQNFFESKAVFSPNSPTGFTKWDANSKQMSPWTNMVKNDLIATSSNQVEQKPYKQGVPVATIVGYYDPDKQLSSYIYPALHGSFGAVYEDNFTDSSCKLNVLTRNAGTKVFNLYARRLDQDSMNKIHVNIEEALEPYSANVSCDGNILASLELNEAQKELNTSVVSFTK